MRYLKPFVSESNNSDDLSNLRMCFNSFDDISCSISDLDGGWRKIVIIDMPWLKYKYNDLKDLVEESVEKSNEFGFYCSAVFIEGSIRDMQQIHYINYGGSYMWLGDSDLKDEHKHKFYNPEFELPRTLLLTKIGDKSRISSDNAYIFKINVYFKHGRTK